MAVAQSFGVLSYSGALFNKGVKNRPISTLIGGKAKYTDHVEFVTGQYFTVGGGSQPAISETASLTAPAATSVTREQKTNLCQIFQKSYGVSYAKQSNMGTLSGVNIANQKANPINELDFQAAAKMEEIANDIEYTIVNGVYNKATSDAEINKTRGLVSAITTNEIDMDGAALGIWDVAEGMKDIYEQNCPTAGLVLVCDPVTMYQLNADCVQNGMSAMPLGRAISGIQLNQIVTPLGNVDVIVGQYLPAGTALLLNIDQLAPVLMNVPGKGNFFAEKLSQVGAGETYQIFGQFGLDHGYEACHAKFTDIATTFTKPTWSRSVYVANAGEFPGGEG